MMLFLLAGRLLPAPTLDFRALDAYIAKFRAGSPNIAAAFDETKKILTEMNGRI